MASNTVGKEDQTTAKSILRVPCEVYSRIVGYLRPVQAWNKGKQQEFRDRKTFTTGKADSSAEQE